MNNNNVAFLKELLQQQDWADLLKTEINKLYFHDLEDFLKREYQSETVYPQREDIFNALLYTSFTNTKVVILGQDPYHGPNQAHGLSFSVNKGVKLPPSLINIFKELKEDIGYNIPINGSLEKWAHQGVLLLNTVLTVRDGEANSHKGKGWEPFTDRIISLLNEREKPVIFILWGKPAQQKLALIDSKHYVITAPHPSPLSAHRGFFGSKPFSKVNNYLRAMQEKGIDWGIEDK